jgi:hypothetical protein
MGERDYCNSYNKTKLPRVPPVGGNQLLPHPACRGKEDAWNWVTATLQSTGRSALARLLAKRLASLWDAQVVLEQPEENPFLADFYRNAGQHAFQTQVFFLLQRIRQLQAARSGAAGGALRRRFHAGKGHAFAGLTLAGEELAS